MATGHRVIGLQGLVPANPTMWGQYVEWKHSGCDRMQKCGGLPRASASAIGIDNPEPEFAKVSRSSLDVWFLTTRSTLMAKGALEHMCRAMGPSNTCAEQCSNAHIASVDGSECSLISAHICCPNRAQTNT